MEKGFVLIGITGMIIASGMGGSVGGSIGALVGWTVVSTLGMLGG